MWFIQSPSKFFPTVFYGPFSWWICEWVNTKQLFTIAHAQGFSLDWLDKPDQLPLAETSGWTCHGPLLDIQVTVSAQLQMQVPDKCRQDMIYWWRHPGPSAQLVEGDGLACWRWGDSWGAMKSSAEPLADWQQLVSLMGGSDSLPAQHWPLVLRAAPFEGGGWGILSAGLSSLCKSGRPRVREGLGQIRNILLHQYVVTSRSDTVHVLADIVIIIILCLFNARWQNKSLSLVSIFLF